MTPEPKITKTCKGLCSEYGANYGRTTLYACEKCQYTIDLQTRSRLQGNESYGLDSKVKSYCIPVTQIVGDISRIYLELL